MPAQPERIEVPDVSLMGREELIRTLLELNHRSTFRFTRAWLRRQWTRRLRSLVASACRQYQETGP